MHRIRLLRFFSSKPHPQANIPAERLKQAVDAWNRPYTPGILSPKEFKQFFDDGFVIKHNVFSPQEPVITETMSAIDQMVDNLAQSLHRAGKIKSIAKEYGFYQRLIKLEEQFPSASVLLHKQGILPPAFAKLWTDNRLLNVATQILGPELAGHPVWNLRTKVPRQEQATVPWHQDAGYLDPESWSVLQLTAWIPLINSNRENGCMQIARGGHRTGKTATHTCCAGGTWYIDLSEEEMEKTLGVKMDTDIVTCEVPLGSVLFLNNLVPHRSLDNNSSQIRWSLDLRWQNPALPNGFYGLKPSILMRTSKDPNYQPKWDEWAKINRAQLQDEAVRKQTGTGEGGSAPAPQQTSTDTFDTTISGPWMATWHIAHHNRHSAAFSKEAPITKA